MNDKEFALEQIKLLSALESWAFCQDTRLPDYLIEDLTKAIDKLSREILR